LQFPHHENELAQSESFTGVPFARYWLHNGLMKMGHAKMAGSVGNVINVVDLLKAHHPETVRFLLLSTHYRSPIEYSEERLHELRRGLEGFYRFFERYQRVTQGDFYGLEAPTRRADFAGGTAFLDFVGELRERFLDCMDDDFNTGGAIGVLNEVLTALNRFADTRKLEDPSRLAGDVDEFRRGAVVLRELSQVLGLFREPVTAGKGGDERLVDGLLGLLRELGQEAAAQAVEPRTADGLMQLLIRLRAEARKAKNFAVADQIRKRLGELGVTLEDRPGGTGWRVG